MNLSPNRLNFLASPISAISLLLVYDFSKVRARPSSESNMEKYLNYNGVSIDEELKRIQELFRKWDL